MTVLSFFMPAGISVGCFVIVLFLLSLMLKRNDIADVAWGPGIALVVWSTYISTSISTEVPVLIVLGLVTVWAIRLGWRIGRKNFRKSEDLRYKRWRDSWGRSFYMRSFLQVYLLQGTLMLALGSSAIGLFSQTTLGTTPLITLGILLWLVGFYFEVVGDAQLDRFLKNKKNHGKLMCYGLWHYTRHPNYFGEITMWWAIALICLAAGAPFWVLISPITITILILYVSGIPLLETQMQKHPEWADYAEKTSVLVPWFPKKSDV